VGDVNQEISNQPQLTQTMWAQELTFFSQSHKASGEEYWGPKMKQAPSPVISIADDGRQRGDTFADDKPPLMTTHHEIPAQLMQLTRSMKGAQ